MPVSHFKVRLIGAITGGEQWSCGISYDTISGEPIFIDQVGLAEWAARIRDTPVADLIPAGLRALMSTAVTVQRIRVEYYGDDGLLQDAGEATFAVPYTGQAGASMPSQCAVCVTLNTDRPGRSYSGRFYWPALGATLSNATMRLTPAQTLAIAQAAAGMIQKIASVGPVLLAVQPVVASQTKGETTRVRSVRVGDVIDTQRRRRDDYNEVYTTVGLV